MSDPQPFILPEGEGARHAPHTARNRDPLVDALRPLLPVSGLVVEVASGTGEHVVHFARRFAELDWQPTDADPQAIESIKAWQAARPAPNLRAPLLLDVTQPWPVERADAVLVVNLLHISLWQATEGLMASAGRVLSAGAPLLVYGAFWRSGIEPAPSNLVLDENLRARDPSWGVRRLEAVTELATRAGLTLASVTEMPANNLLVEWRRS